MFPIPLTPYSDKQVFWQKIRDDPEILRLMGWTKAAPVELAKNIILRKPNADVFTASKKLISIYNAPSRRTGSVVFANCVVQIDVTVPVDESKTADLVVERIVNMFRYTQINKRPVHFDTALGDYTAPAGFYCHAMRFFYYSHI